MAVININNMNVQCEAKVLSPTCTKC